MAIEVTKAAYISKKATLEKATVEKLEAIEDDNKRVEAVGKPTKPRMAEILVMYGKTVRLHTPKGIFWLGCILLLNALGVIKNGTVV